MPQRIWGRQQVLQKIPPVFVWSWPLCTVHYDISLDSIVSVLHTGNMIQLLTHISFGFRAKNQMLDQALQWIRIPGIVHLNQDEPERMLCWKSDVNTSPSVQVWLHIWPVDGVPFHMRQILPGRPCQGRQCYSCPAYLLWRYHGPVSI